MQHLLAQQSSSLRLGSPCTITLNGKLITTFPKASSSLGLDCPSSSPNEFGGGPSCCCLHGNYSSQLPPSPNGAGEQHSAGVPSSAFCGVSVPSRNNGAAISQSVRTHHKDPVISWLGGFQKKGDTKPSSGHLSKGKTPLGKSLLFGVQDIPADCNESPLVQRPPTICL